MLNDKNFGELLNESIGSGLTIDSTKLSLCLTQRSNCMPKMQTNANVYRFGDAVAINTTSKNGAETCPTIYLSPDMAIATAKAILEAAQDCQKCWFEDSKLKPVVVSE